MAEEELKRKVRDALTQGYFRDAEDLVSVSDSDEVPENLHVVVVSPKFRGKHLAEKTDLILNQLLETLPADDWGRVHLSIGVTPEDLRAI